MDPRLCRWHKCVKCFVFLYSSCCRTFDFKRSSFMIIVASLVLSSFLVLFCFVSRFFTCQQRICIANMQFFCSERWSKRGHTFRSTKHYLLPIFDQFAVYIWSIRGPLSSLVIANIVVILLILFTFFIIIFRSRIWEDPHFLCFNKVSQVIYLKA